jgi:hypothetical protein
MQATFPAYTITFIGLTGIRKVLREFKIMHHTMHMYGELKHDFTRS